MLSEILSWGITLLYSAFAPVLLVLVILFFVKKITKKILWKGIKLAVVVYLAATFVIPAVTGCGSDAKSSEEQTGADELTSSVTKLGTYTGLSYTDGSGRVPTDEEVQEEMEAILLWFEDAELTEDWVKENLDFDSIDDFREDTRHNLMTVYDERAWKASAKELFETVIADSEFDLSDADLETVYKRYENTYQQYADMLDLTLEEYVTQELGTDMEQFQKDGEDAAEMVLKTKLVADAIAKAENLDYDASYEEIANQIVAEEGYDSLTDLEEAAGGKEELRDEVTYRMAAQFMMEQATPVSES